MKPLDARLKSLIKAQGSLTISQFIILCLADREQGYYHHADPFGRQGDFITAPEVSQMFGEMLGLWVVNAWQQLGKPQELVFCEMGPGRGTLMDDMVRTIKKLMPVFFDAAHIILVETSLKLRTAITIKLKPHALDIKFAYHVEELPPLPLILIGNELLDCLPIHQYVRAKAGWHERMVTLDDEDRLCFGLSPHHADLEHLAASGNWFSANAPPGTVVEISPVREALIAKLGQHMVGVGGTALFVDYGSLTSGFGDTLQAISRHKYQNPLAAPGRHDLTSHVDFSALITQARATGCNSAAMTQGAFLKALGIEHRAAQLRSGCDHATRYKIEAELERLTARSGMGEIFKAFYFSQPASLIFPFESRGGL